MARPARFTLAALLLSLAGSACGAPRRGDPRPQPSACGPNGAPCGDVGPAGVAGERRPADAGGERGPTDVTKGGEPAGEASGAAAGVASGAAAGVASGAAAGGGAPSSGGAERGPAPELPPGERVRLSDLANALERIAVALEREPAVRADFEALRRAHALADDASLYRDYVRVKLVFESVRDGGLWQLRWAITDREANSDAIWSQWARLGPWVGEPDRPTATAECDELSALFAFLVRRLGVTRVGLFWPTWNHTVAVWTARGEGGQPVRVVVPTSQIFLSEGDSLGTGAFDPRRQKTIFDYGRRDARDDVTLPAELARFFVRRTWAEALRPQAELQRARNERSRALGGS